MERRLADQLARQEYARTKAEALEMLQLWQEGRAPRAFELGIFCESLRGEPARLELEKFRKQRADSGPGGAEREGPPAEAVLTALLEESAKHPEYLQGRLCKEVAATSRERLGRRISASTVRRLGLEKASKRFVPWWIRWARYHESQEGSPGAKQKAARQAACKAKGSPPSVLDLSDWALLKHLWAGRAAKSEARLRSATR